MLFLSTLPARGATVGGRVLIQPIVISIHAPREGSDVRCARCRGRASYFYPRSPRGERRRALVTPHQLRHISIHAPREGSDCRLPSFCVLPLSISIHAPREGSDPVIPTPERILNISIHAPREGSDDRRHRLQGDGSFISIHAPREGSDDGQDVVLQLPRGFLSTLPVRGATRPGDPHRRGVYRFLSTLPVRGATYPHQRHRPADQHFYPRSP